MVMEDSEFFKNRKLAHDWMVGSGYPVSRGKFYEDCAGGLITINQDKTVSRFQTLQYAVAWQQKTVNPAGVDIPGGAEADLRKKLADADIAESKARKMTREENDLWLYADDAWALLAGLVAQIRSSSRHHMYSSRRELVEIAKGDQDKADELYNAIEGLLDVAMNEVAGKDIKVEFKK